MDLWIAMLEANSACAITLSNCFGFSPQIQQTGFSKGQLPLQFDNPLVKKFYPTIFQARVRPFPQSKPKVSFEFRIPI